MASSMTIPGATGTRYCSALPPWLSPRNTSKIASAIPFLRYLSSTYRLIYLFILGKNLLQFLRYGGNRLLAKRHGSALRGDDIVLLPPGGVQRRIIDAAVRSAALAACQSATCDGIRNRQHRS